MCVVSRRGERCVFDGMSFAHLVSFLALATTASTRFWATADGYPSVGYGSLLTFTMELQHTRSLGHSLPSNTAILKAPGLLGNWGQISPPFSSLIAILGPTTRRLFGLTALSPPA